LLYSLLYSNRPGLGLQGADHAIFEQRIAPRRPRPRCASSGDSITS
jgi:hypothetical protein